MIGNTESIERDWSIAHHYVIMHISGRRVQEKRRSLAQILAYLLENPVEDLDHVLIGAYFEEGSQEYHWVPTLVLMRWMGVA